MTRRGAAATQRRTQAQRRAETRAAVLESARRLFGEKGYADTSIEEIAASCGTTIRPIYHYFGSKLDLFTAVTELQEERIVAALTQSRPPAPDATLAVWRSFLELCRDPAFRRIVLVDAPRVLGRERWATSAVTRKAAGLLRRGRAAGSPEARELSTRMLMGALAEAASTIAESDEPERTSRVADELVSRLVGALAPPRAEVA